MDTGTVLEKIAAERQRQNNKWGDQKHDNGTWALILIEEVGEAAQEALKDRDYTPDSTAHHLQLIKELTEVAAVAVAWIEDLRENGRKQA